MYFVVEVCSCLVVICNQALNGLYCADVLLRNYSLSNESISYDAIKTCVQMPFYAANRQIFVL